MFHSKSLRMSHFDGKGKRMMNEISVHLTIKSIGRLLHNTIVIKWEVLIIQIVRLQCLN